MTNNRQKQECILIIISPGFEALLSITLLTAVRQAGLCIKTLSLSKGPIKDKHGIALMPDLTINSLKHPPDFVKLVILPQAEASLLPLTLDPRLHQFLRQVVATGGQIITGLTGLGVIRAAAIWISENGQMNGSERQPVILQDPNWSPTTFANQIIDKLRR